jgi:hypothetical protein
MKITRDFSHGAFNGVGGRSLTRDEMHELGGDALRQLRDVAGVLDGEVPKGIGDTPRATQAGAITAEEHDAQVKAARQPKAAAKKTTAKPSTPPPPPKPPAQ